MTENQDSQAQPTIAAYTDHFIREVKVRYRRTAQERFAIGSADDVAQFVRQKLVDNSREQLFALYLDATHRVAAYSLISIGTANAAMIHPREVFQRAVVVGAVALAVAHNHPSGECKPSEADHLVTDKLKQAGNMIGIPLIDHVIVGHQCRFSFRDGNLDW
jgi:DNA repair protein RadC